LSDLSFPCNARLLDNLTTPRVKRVRVTTETAAGSSALTSSGPPISSLRDIPAYDAPKSGFVKTAEIVADAAPARSEQGEAPSSLIARLRSFNASSDAPGERTNLLLPPISLLPERYPNNAKNSNFNGNTGDVLEVIGMAPVSPPVAPNMHSQSAFVSAATSIRSAATLRNINSVIAGSAASPEASKIFHCILCPASFSRRDNLKKHERATHLNERPFPCGVCGRAFQKKDHREKHVRIVHMGLRSYACDRCPSKFGQRSDLNKHKSTVHEKERNYTCDICNRAFGHLGNKLRHARVVHAKVKPFKCGDCDAAFGEKSNLTKHCFAMHSKKLTNWS
jgi:hypothetical protein